MLGLALLFPIAACDGVETPRWSPGVGVPDSEEHGHEEARRPTPPPPPGIPKNLLEEYAKRDAASVGESLSWDSPQAKRIVIASLILAAQDRRVRREQEGQDAIQAGIVAAEESLNETREKVRQALKNAKKQDSPNPAALAHLETRASILAAKELDTDPDSPLNRLHLPLEFTDLFTKDARWGLPDRREPMARPIGDGVEAFEHLRKVAARFPARAAYQCRAHPPGAEVTVSTGAEPMWCYYHQPPHGDMIVYKLVTEAGRLRIAYLGFFSEKPTSGVRVLDYGNPPPATVPTKRRGAMTSQGQPRGRGAMLSGR